MAPAADDTGSKLAPSALRVVHERMNEMAERLAELTGEVAGLKTLLQEQGRRHEACIRLGGDALKYAADAFKSAMRPESLKWVALITLILVGGAPVSLALADRAADAVFGPRLAEVAHADP